MFSRDLMNEDRIVLCEFIRLEDRDNCPFENNPNER